MLDRWAKPGKPVNQKGRAVAGGIGLVVIATVFVIIFFVLPHNLKLMPKITSFQTSGPTSVLVTWSLTNTGGQVAFDRHCTVSVLGARGQVLGSSSGGPFPSQITHGPISAGDSWHTTTTISTVSGAAHATRATVACTGTVNAGK